ncbi:MAG: Co2+/Mg2+ efflux protein ApaG [Bacteroidetes bacterium]|nr:Co2+/Mg2+ efflux protein ApaG [Bacteroidota bacterium]
MNKCITSEKVTSGIRVRTFPEYIPESSVPQEGKYFFAYRIQIANESEHPVQLLSRHWVIINSEGETEEVTGPGVIGKTPVLQPGEQFEYTSFCPLNTSWGTMEGSYQFISHEGVEFDVAIDRFVLVSDQPDS